MQLQEFKYLKNLLRGTWREIYRLSVLKKKRTFYHLTSKNGKPFITLFLLLLLLLTNCRIDEEEEVKKQLRKWLFFVRESLPSPVNDHLPKTWSSDSMASSVLKLSEANKDTKQIDRKVFITSRNYRLPYRFDVGCGINQFCSLCLAFLVFLLRLGSLTLIFNGGNVSETDLK